MIALITLPTQIETAASPAALDAGRAREARALANEAAARKPEGWDYLAWRDVYLLRDIARITAPVLGHPRDDRLAGA
jgi:hypothetical protein